MMGATSSNDISDLQTVTINFLELKITRLHPDMCYLLWISGSIVYLQSSMRIYL